MQKLTVLNPRIADDTAPAAPSPSTTTGRSAR